QEIAALMNEPPECLVEKLPALRVGRGRRAAGPVPGLARDRPDLRRWRVLDRDERGLGTLPDFPPAHVGGRRAVTQEQPRGRLPALERRLDLHRSQNIACTSPLAIATEKTVLGTGVRVAGVGGAVSLTLE